MPERGEPVVNPAWEINRQPLGFSSSRNSVLFLPLHAALVPLTGAIVPRLDRRSLFFRLQLFPWKLAPADTRPALSTVAGHKQEI